MFILIQVTLGVKRGNVGKCLHPKDAHLNWFFGKLSQIINIIFV
ncbi:hypothetical protein THERMOT_2138 [Bathymodiolus thermophilus thioautotrophic gill symbiont]|nr:hypothetical protein THERMOT_2138 [Bathymodiolus thermophilus thioautotrophic gill symbiont]